MEYRVKTIGSEEEILSCERFEVNHFQWHCVVTPPTCGYMGYIKGKGLYIRMICQETDPLVRCRNHHDMVCKDSAMEAFFAFAPKERGVTNDDMYLNFEVNASGAMYAKYGFGRKGRQFLSDEIYKASGIKAETGDGSWQISLLVPESFLETVCDWRADGSGKEMYCNFYKISEDPEIEHYGSFMPINSETPNFHRPVDFIKAVIISAE